ncbi:hypothetical protein N5C12_00200 [Comamonas aquatica]|uniref:hypothetical protein n=1 Tax=Comamonas aquatica TaxID=225991 RepID=UPI00244C3D30|nr:hypothetical protein [Comamonas aquatica]MDH0897785.1 hypothetical protein [Comamonas aquatica]
MNYQAAKSFDRDGTRYRPGDDLPEGLDKVAIAHYLRHGMIREAPAPGTTKPAGPAQSPATGPSRKRESAKPKEVKEPPPPPVAAPALSAAASVGSTAGGQDGEAAAPAADSAAAGATVAPSADGEASAPASEPSPASEA